jgi:hypothetical protein
LNSVLPLAGQTLYLLTHVPSSFTLFSR